MARKGRGKRNQGKSRSARKARRASQRRTLRAKLDRALREFGITGKIKNEALRNMISDATSGKTSALNELEVRSFWALTRDIWNRDDVPADRRYEAIMKHFGTDNLADAIGMALLEVEEKFRAATQGVGIDGADFVLGRYSVNRMFGAGFFSVAQ